MAQAHTPDAIRLLNAVGNTDVEIIDIDTVALATVIWSYLRSVAQIHVVLAGDLTIFLNNAGARPTNMTECLSNGCKFFDSIYYLGLSDKDTVDHKAFASVPNRVIKSIADVQKTLLLFYLYIMFRGGYPTAKGTTMGRDIPAFLVNMLSMKGSPDQLANDLASFDIHKVPIGWIRYIDVKLFAPEIQQRIALGMPGYRTMMPFVHYPIQSGVPNDVKEAYEWVRRLAMKPADWAIHPATRSAQLTQQLKSFNKALGNLSLLCFTQQQFDEMTSAQVKLLFAKPIRDPRSDSWRAWVTIGDIPLNDPIIK